MLRRFWPLAVLLVGVGMIIVAYISSKPRGEEVVGDSAEQQVVTQQSNTQPQTGTVTVTYTNKGFTPNEITITKGTTVNFINESDIPLWVASDPHPSHTGYPEFDTPMKLDRMPELDEDFSFTFDKVGKWEYHSHTASGDNTEVGVHPGVVIVK